MPTGRPACGASRTSPGPGARPRSSSARSIRTAPSTAALANAEVTLVDPVAPAGGPVAQIVNGIARRSLARRRDRRGARVAGADDLGRRRDRHDAHPRLRRGPAAASPRPTSDGEPGWPVLLPSVHLDAFAALAVDRMPADLFADLEASGIPFRDIETGDPGVTHDVSTARADLPPYAGPPEPPTRHAHEWGSAAGRRAGRCAGHRPGPPHDARRLSRVRRPRRRTVGIALVVLVAILVGAAAWYVQPQPRAPRGDGLARVDARGHVLARGPRPRMGARRRDADHGPHRLSRRQGPARGLRADGPGDRRGGLSRRDHADAVQPRGARHRRGRSRPRRAPRDRDAGSSPATRWVARWPRRRREPSGRLRRAGVLGGVRGDGPVGARPRGDLDLRDARRRRGSDVRPRGAGGAPCPMPRSSRSRAATTSRWAGTRGSRTIRR